MPRKQGVGMRRPKKTKVAVVEEARVEPSAIGADEGAAARAGDALPPDSQAVESEDDDTPYKPTALDLAEVKYQVACDTFVKSEKLYKKAEAAHALQQRLFDAKSKRILANQQRAPHSKQWRYVDKLQELRLEKSQAEIMSLRLRVLMEQMLNASVSCDVKRKVLEMRRLRAELRRYKPHRA